MAGRVTSVNVNVNRKIFKVVLIELKEKGVYDAHV